MALTKRSPAGRPGLGGTWAIAAHEKRQANPSTRSPVDEVLARLDKVRPSGTGRNGRSWMARCPAHDDRSPSLRVTEADDGRVLLFCNAGCSGADIVAAIGLSLADLYPGRIADHLPPTERKQFLDARAKLKELRFEVLLVAVAAENLRQGVALDDADRARLWEAAHKIRAAAEAV